MRRYPNSKLDPVKGVYDGDSFWLLIDVGFRHFTRQPIRLFGIDTPEVRTKNKKEKAAGYAARDRVRELFSGDQTITVETMWPPDKYGRCLARIFLEDARSVELGFKPTGIKDNLISLTKILIMEGHGYPYFGGKKKKYNTWSPKPINHWTESEDWKKL